MEIRPTSFAEIAYLSTMRLLVSKGSQFEVAGAFVVSDADNKHFLVTARHVVENATSVTLHFYSGENGPDLGPPIRYEIRQPHTFWHVHSDQNVDVAVASLAEVAAFLKTENMTFFIASIPAQWFAPKWRQGPPSPFDGFGRPRALDQLLLVGYPNDYRDNPTGLPVLRRGFTATPLWLDHEKRPAFLIDTTASHGTSGGPVFYVDEMRQAGPRMHLTSGRLVLLGVFSEVLPPKTTNAPERSSLRPPNLGAAYKTHAIVEALTRIGFALPSPDEGSSA